MLLKFHDMRNGDIVRGTGKTDDWNSCDEVFQVSDIDKYGLHALFTVLESNKKECIGLTYFFGFDEEWTAFRLEHEYSNITPLSKTINDIYLKEKIKLES